MRLLWFILAMLSIVLTLSAAASAADYALVVGIGDWIDDGPPKAPTHDLAPLLVNDGRAMVTLFQDMGLPPENICYLENHAATKQAVYDAFALLGGKCDKTSTVYFFWAGHGTTGLTDTNGDEADGVDEALCPADMFHALHFMGLEDSNPEMKKAMDESELSDDELNVLINQLAARAGWIVMLIESCHSGGLPKGLTDDWSKYFIFKKNTDMTLEKLPLADRLDLSSLTFQMPPEPQTPPSDGSNAGVGTDVHGDTMFDEASGVPSNVVILTACQPQQTSRGDETLGMGLFTCHVLNTIYNENKQADTNGDGLLTWDEVAQYIYSLNVGVEEELPVLYNEALAKQFYIPPSAVGLGRKVEQPIPLYFMEYLEAYIARQNAEGGQQ